MNHGEILEAIELRSRIEKLDVDDETRERLLASIPKPKSVPWDLVSKTIQAREVAESESSLLDNMIDYYKEVVASAERRLEEAQTVKESLTEHIETVTYETWGG